MKKTFFAAMLAASTLLAPVAHSAMITTWNVNVNTIFDTTSVQPAGVNVLNNQSLRWGTSTGDGQSGLDI